MIVSPEKFCLLWILPFATCLWDSDQEGKLLLHVFAECKVATIEGVFLS